MLNASTSDAFFHIDTRESMAGMMPSHSVTRHCCWMSS